MSEFLLFFAAGLLGGLVNAAAGGAKLFVFPMLLAAGVPPLAANATGTVALWPAQISAVWVHRHRLSQSKTVLFRQMLPALIGSLVGAVALILSSEAAFLAAIPALLIIAVGAIVAGRRLTGLMRRAFPGERLQKAATVLMFAVGFYGGYFGAGMGFMLIAVLMAAVGMAIQEANAVKNLTAFMINSVAVIPLSFSGLVVWDAAAVVLVGGLIGGYFGGILTQHMPETPMRIGVAALGCVLVASFLLRG